ncbi:MAG: type II toxin-antitoxin system RelE/ParE family toxin [Actinobacteria bacterium]|nr:type II toxin-antitoxin system RelE/ParE family toxin [Actinomycetota bacterium]
MSSGHPRAAYRLRITYDAQRALTQAPPVGLSSTTAWEAYTFITSDLLTDPAAAGIPLAATLTGVWSAHRDGYRVLYEMDEIERVVTVLVIRREPGINPAP